MSDFQSDSHSNLSHQIDDALNLLNRHITYLSNLKNLVLSSPANLPSFDIKHNQLFADYVDHIKHECVRIFCNDKEIQSDNPVSESTILFNPVLPGLASESQLAVSDQAPNNFSSEVHLNDRDDHLLAQFLNTILEFNIDDPRFKRSLQMWQPAYSNTSSLAKQCWSFDILISKPLCCDVFDETIQHKLSSIDNHSEIRKLVFHIFNSILVDTQVVERALKRLDEIVIIQSKSFYLVGTLYLLLLMAWSDFDWKVKYGVDLTTNLNNFLNNLETLFVFSCVFAECSLHMAHSSSEMNPLNFLDFQESLVLFMSGVSKKFDGRNVYGKFPPDARINLQDMKQLLHNNKMRNIDFRDNKESNPVSLLCYLLTIKSSSDLKFRYHKGSFVVAS
jgi:hypothetical protein